MGPAQARLSFLSWSCDTLCWTYFEILLRYDVSDILMHKRSIFIYVTWPPFGECLLNYAPSKGRAWPFIIAFSLTFSGSARCIVGIRDGFYPTALDVVVYQVSKLKCLQGSCMVLALSSIEHCHIACGGFQSVAPHWTAAYDGVVSRLEKSTAAYRARTMCVYAP